MLAADVLGDADRAGTEAGRIFWSGQWLGVMGNHMVNEVRVFRVTEELHVGDRALFEAGGNKVYELTGTGQGE